MSMELNGAVRPDPLVDAYMDGFMMGALCRIQDAAASITRWEGLGILSRAEQLHLLYHLLTSYAEDELPDNAEYMAKDAALYEALDGRNLADLPEDSPLHDMERERAELHRRHMAERMQFHAHEHAELERVLEMKGQSPDLFEIVRNTGRELFHQRRNAVTAAL